MLLFMFLSYKPCFEGICYNAFLQRIIAVMNHATNIKRKAMFMSAGKMPAKKAT